MSEQPEALRLANLLETDGWPDAAAELRGMYERIQLLYEQLNEAEKQLDAQYKLGMEAEREACARVCDDIWQDDGTAYDCREAIRARGKEPELEHITYKTAGAVLEEGFYSVDDLQDILKSLEDLNPRGNDA